MLITVMYMYGMIQQAWGFSWLYVIACFFIDVTFIGILSQNVRIIHKTSDEEKECWRKKCEVEELRRVKLDRELYGGKRD